MAKLQPAPPLKKMSKKLTVAKKAWPRGIMPRAEAVGWAKAARVALEDVEDGGTERRCEVLERIELRLRWLLKKRK